MKATLRLFRTRDGSALVEEGDPRAAFLAYIQDEEISPEDEARLKALHAPVADKAVHAPAATKAHDPTFAAARRRRG